MGVALMTDEQLKMIGAYVKDHMVDWIRESNIAFTQNKASEEVDRQITVHERMVRVEEGIHHQGELMQQMLNQFEKRFEQVDKRFEQVEKRFEQMDKRFEQIDKRFDQVDKRFEQVDKRFEQVDKRFELVDKRFTELREDMNTRFNRMFAYFTTGFIMIATLMSVYQFLT